MKCSCSIEEAIDHIRQGKMIILVDDEDRENEGDLTMVRRKGHPGGDQFHGHTRPGIDLPEHVPGPDRPDRSADDGQRQGQ